MSTTRVALIALLLGLTLTGCSIWDARFHERMNRVRQVRDILDVYSEALRNKEPDSLRPHVTRPSTTDEEGRHIPSHYEDPIDRVESLLKPFRNVEWAWADLVDFEDLADGSIRGTVEVRIDGISRDNERMTVRARAPVQFIKTATPFGTTDLSIVRHNRFQGGVTSSRRAPTYTDVAKDVRADFPQNHQPFHGTSAMMSNIHPGNGLAVIDVNGDGREDVFLVDGKTSRLLLNLGGEGKGKPFRDIGSYTGLSKATGTGACAADVNGDGRTDLVVTNTLGGLRLFMNAGRNSNGKTTFKETTATCGFQDESKATSAAFADVDGDGDLDLYVCNTGNYYKELPLPVWQGMNGVPNSLYLNKGDGTFREAAMEWGVDHKGWSLACGFADVDRDGRPDLYVANDFGPNRLFWNRGDHFQDVTADAGVSDRGYGMGVAWGDVDGDGDLDLSISNIYCRYQWIYRDPDLPLPPLGRVFRSRVTGWLLTMTRGNSLYLNVTESGGEPEFVDVSAKSGLADAGWAWGARWVDYDLDGDLDLIVPNGLVPGIGKDKGFDFWHDSVLYWEEYAEQTKAFERGKAGVHGKEATRLFRNEGPAHEGGPPAFREVAYSEGIASYGSSRSVVISDIDQDGGPDLIVRDYEAPVRVYRHKGPEQQNWLSIKLVGKAPNTTAVGAQVAVWAGELVQLKTVEAGGGYLSSSSPRLHFGLGAHATADKVQVVWPGGAALGGGSKEKRLELGPIHANLRIRITEGSDRYETAR